MNLEPRSLLAAVALATLAVAPSGCIGGLVADGQISATRRASTAINTIADYELQRSAVAAGLSQFEGMHLLRPDNDDALLLLTQGWGGYGYAVVEDDYEEAIDHGDDDLASYHKKRARLAYDRAVFYGLELLSHRFAGFDDAKRNASTLEPWLQRFTSEEDAAALFWTGYAWLSRVNLLKDNGALVGDLFIGVAMMDRSVAIDPSLEHWSGTVALAAYHARPMGESDQAKQMFDLALARSERKNLQVQLNYATSYACAKGDRALYESLLNEVLTVVDPDPEQRLVNTLAKRRARRALGKQRMMDCGFDMSPHPHPAAPPPSSATQAAPAPTVSPATPIAVPQAPAPTAALPVGPPPAPLSATVTAPPPQH
jgi:hypothetical protein